MFSEFEICILLISLIAPTNALPAESVLTVDKSDKTGTKQGWTSTPDGRGTLDIVWSCAFTMSLCSWSILCLNVPGPYDSRFRLLHRKLWITTLAFLGPEFIFILALGQWLSARRSVKEFRASQNTQWTMKHAFFADMGGFMLHTRDCTPFPVDAKQLHYLVTEGYAAIPTLNERDIADKNKADSLLRILTLLQILWFIINTSARAAQRLSITCAELTTAAFIVHTVGTSLCWVKKPADVMTPEIIEIDVTVAEIRLRANIPAGQDYVRTPLDFISRKEWSWSLYWSNWINILRNMHIVFSPSAKPVDRFENTTSLELPGGTFYIFFGTTAAYSAIFISGWNYEFPTQIEQTLWRAASTTLMGCLIGAWAVTDFAFVVYPAILKRLAPNRSRDISLRTISRTHQHKHAHGLVRAMKTVAYHIRNNSASKDPQLTVPLKAILPMYLLGLLYCHARLYIFIADIIELRSLPASAYQTVNWSNFIPHFAR